MTQKFAFYIPSLMLGLLLPIAGQAALSQQFYQDAAGLGDAQAGSAASAMDASTEFYNPAGLVRIKQQQLVIGNNMNMPTEQFSGSSTVNSTTLSGDAEGGNDYSTPYLHYAAPISPTWAFGFGISTPFQTNTSWSDSSSVSPYATDTKYAAYMVSTDLAYAITSKFSIGAGYDFIRTIISDYNYNTPLNGSDYQVNLSGTQWTQSYHLGLLYQFTPKTRAGLAYHAKIDYITTGDASIINETSNITVYSDSDYKLQGVFPAYTTLSLYHELNPKWTLEGTVNYTEWDQVGQLVYDNTTTEDYDFKNTWRFAVGAHYVINPQLLLRFGTAYETSPYNNNDIQLTAPVGASYDTSVGLHVIATDTLGIDLGWTHVFYQDLSVDGDNIKSDTETFGDFTGSNDILGVQLVWNMT